MIVLTEIVSMFSKIDNTIVIAPSVETINKRLCQNVGTTFFYNLSSCYLFFCLRRFFLIHLVTSCYIPVVSGYK